MSGLAVLQVGSHSRITSGGAIQMMRLALSMRDRGHRVACVFQYRPSDPVPGRGTFERFAAEGIAIRSFPFKKWPRRFLAIQALRRFIREGDFDVVHCHKTVALQASIDALSGNPRPALIGNRGNSYPLDPREVRAYTHPRVDRIIAVADAVKLVMIHSAPTFARTCIDPTRIAVVYGGVDEKRFHPGVSGASIRREFHATDGQFLVGIVANLDKKKGHGEFLRAAAIVRRERPDARFFLVGGGHPERVLPIVRALDLGDSVVLTGFRDDVPEILAALDVVVCSSTEGEGLTGVLREALAMARPVVTTNVAGNSELVRNGETGLLVPIEDPGTLAGAILALARDPALGARLGAAGRKLVLESFTNDVRVRRIEEIYQDAASARQLAAARLA